MSCYVAVQLELSAKVPHTQSDETSDRNTDEASSSRKEETTNS
jgi:hypothetical protein